MPTTDHPLAKLHPHDAGWLLRRMPRSVMDAMMKYGPALVLAGGFIRGCIANEHLSDIDLFTTDEDTAWAVACELAGGDEKRVHRTDNAFTVKGYRVAPQIIHRWTFANPQEVIPSFDFTIARACLWWQKPEDIASDPERGKKPGVWRSLCDPDFYADLAGKRLVYRQPIRIEESGGSLLRILKFYQRGYRIPLDSFGEVIARCIAGVPEINWQKKATIDGQAWEAQIGHVITGLLREVDPAIDPGHFAHLPVMGDETQPEPAPDNADA